MSFIVWSVEVELPAIRRPIPNLTVTRPGEDLPGILPLTKVLY